MVKAKKRTAKKSSVRTTKKKKENKKPSKKEEVIYPEVQTFIRGPEDPITADFAKELLGWTEVEKEEKGFLLRDENGIKIICVNNTTNRPLVPMIYRTLKQEHLRQRWQLNGEPVILGRTGLILENQHTLIALILAQQERDNSPEKWPDCPKILGMQKIIVAGIDESDVVVNTINTGKPRSLADVFYRGGYFTDVGVSDRGRLSTMSEHAVRLLWNRVGAKQDAFNLRRTHTESLDFVVRHPKLLDCVHHVFQETVGQESKPTISPGYLSAMLFLMASSSSSPEKYVGNNPTEELLDWSQWDKACDFVTLVIQNATSVKQLNLAINRKKNTDGISLTESLGLLCNAWTCFSSEKPITAKSIRLRYHTDEDEVSHLLDNPTTGGIDLGSVKEPYTPETQVSPDEVEVRKSEVDAKRKSNKEQNS